MKSLFSITIISCFLLSGCSQPISQQITNQIGNDVTTKNLDLSGQNLQKIPEYVFDMKNLEKLDISNNQITGAIQAEIRQLKNLKELNASDNQMTGVPAEIGQLSRLEILNLSDNQITGLPYELGNLKNLKTLDISGNSYSEIDLDIIQKGLDKNTVIIK